MKPFAFLHSLLVAVFAILLTLLVSLVSLLWMGVLRRSSDEAQVFVRWWGRCICAVSGVRVDLEGEERLTADQPYIFAANHQSQYDIIALQGYLRFSFRWLAKKELFRVPIWGNAMKMAGYIPVDRSHGRQALKSLEEAARSIAEGTSVIIFPEGTRSLDGKLQPFKAGGMVLAIKAGVDLVPVGIMGTHEILPKGSLLLHPGRVRIRLGKPIPTRAYQTRQKHELASRLQREVGALIGQEMPAAEDDQPLSGVGREKSTKAS
jgi:1-acyl-sn-glycerol-3-phosphate acyltransferase